MTWERAVTERLTRDTELAHDLNGRIFWDVADQGAVMPYIVLTVVFDERDRTMEEQQEFRESILQVDIYGPKKMALIALRERVLTVMGEGGEWAGVRFDPAPATRIDGTAELDANSTAIRRESVDLAIWHN